MAITNCPRCHGDIMFDSMEDEYVCILCARRYARIKRTAPALTLESEVAERREANLARGRELIRIGHRVRNAKWE